MSFHFVGQGPCSKSLLLRALIAKSYFPDLKISGDSNCDDVLAIKSGLQNINSNSPVHCGNSGAVFRFLALRASRLKGEYVFFGTPRLFKRPIQ